MKNNYRIKKITTPSGFEGYYPQQKILWLFWVNMFGIMLIKEQMID